MRSFLTFLIMLVMITVTAQPFSAQSTLTRSTSPRFHHVENALAGEYIVMLNDKTARSEISTIANTLARSHDGAVEYVYTDIFKGFSVKNMPAAQAKKLSRHPLVKSVEENGRTVTGGQQPQPGENQVIKPLDRIDQRTGLDAVYNYPRTGTGVHVYIVDTGIWIQHNDFGGRAHALWDFQPFSSIGGYATGQDNHGTMVASAVGSKTWGVAKNALLYSVRVKNNATGAGSNADLVNGLQQVLFDVVNKNKRPAVVNISLAVPVSSGVSSIESAVNSLISNGITVVAGAGNNNADAGSWSPARMAAVITVGATTGVPGVVDNKAGYSNFGTAVDVYAPAGDLGWFPRNAGHNTTYGIDGIQGTSMAAPLATGAAALYLEQFSLDPFNFNAQPAQVQSAIKNNASFTSRPIVYMGCQFIAPPASNPIDDTRTFVRQHYYDFLNRQPDQPGWDFWTGTFNECNGDANCITIKRVNTSKAFFESIEFMDSGYYVFRVNKISFSTFTKEGGFVGPNPRMEQFFIDQKKIGDGVIVGQGNWPQQLETNQSNFAAEWVNRPRFLAEYPLSMTNEAFVDKLYATAGISDPATRNDMVNGLNGGTQTRASVVKTIARSSAAHAAFFNRAYVLMQYFGYLRRNPDDAPDFNLNGYNHWLNELNSGTKTNWDMVRAFIESFEYRDRFFKAPFCTP